MAEKCIKQKKDRQLAVLLLCEKLRSELVTSGETNRAR